MDPFGLAAVRGAYDRVAEDYDAVFGDDLEELPLDRAVLDDALAVGPVLDLGCGPGPVAAHVAAAGLAVAGVDLSVPMVALARRRVPGGAWAAGDARRLPFRSAAFAAVVAYYSLQHLPRSELAGALAEVTRVLQPGGTLVVALHLGEGEVAVDELLGHRFPPMGGTFHLPEEARAAVEAQSLEVVDDRRRPALPHEHPSERIYLTARRP